MISWMQRHKKWLVVTIWISTIAFIGAGFVGWGSYNYGAKNGFVAIVGHRNVSLDEYQREYSMLYDKYAKIFGSSFNKALADKLKLKEAAYKLVIQKNLFLCLADDLGLLVSDEEIAKELVKMPALLKDGKFSKDTYIKVLSENRTDPTKFEASLRRDLLLQKVESIFKIIPNKREIKNLNRLFFSQDNVSIKILKLKDISVDIKDKDVKKYWKENKNSYKSLKAIKLEYAQVPLLSKEFTREEINQYYKQFKEDFKKKDGKIKSLEEAKADVLKALNIKATKKEALKEYLKYKKGKEKFTKEKRLDEIALSYGMENNRKIINAEKGDVIKPFLNNDKYVIVKVLEKIPPLELSYEKVKDKVKVDYKKLMLKRKLDEEANKVLKNFNGTNIGYVSRDSSDKIKGLKKSEVSTFLNRLFSSSTKEGKVTIGNKVVVYKINGAKLAPYDAKKDEEVKTIIDDSSNQELMNNLIKKLESKYEVKSSIEFEG